MKKLLSITIFSLVFINSLNACILPFQYSSPTEEDIIVKSELEATSNDGTDRPKAPRAPIYLTLHSDTITWSDVYSFSFVQLIDSNTGEILYEVSVSSCCVYIPSYLTGNFIIRLYNGISWYSGEFTL